MDDPVGALGEIRLFTTTFVPDRWMACAGQSLDVGQYGELFAVVGNVFGGDGVATFSLPDLRARPVLPGAEAGVGSCMCVTSDLVAVADAPPAAMNVEGSPVLAELRNFAVSFAPTGWLRCDGRIVKIAELIALFALLGTRFGGDGHVTFGLPDLRAHQPWSPPVGAFVGACIATTGQMPDRPGDSPSTKSSGPRRLSLSGIVGEVKLLLASTIGSAWLPCDGRLLPAAQHPELFAVIGGAFGGDGSTTFALPDLRADALFAAGGELLAHPCICEQGQYPISPSA